MSPTVTAVHSRSTNQIAISFSADLQALSPDGLPTAANPSLFTVMVDGRSRRISQVVLEDSRTVVLTVPGRALAQAIELTLKYERPNTTDTSGWLADSTAAPLGSLVEQAVTVLLSAAAMNKAIGGAYTTLKLVGSKPIKGVGNANNNIIIGNEAANALDGGTGADSLYGGKGNDTYSVDDVGDRTVEMADEGVDTVMALLSWTLAENVENLVLLGREVLNGTGNGANNMITGNSASNRLDGGGGDDQLIGGKGDDVYVINSAGDSIRENGLEADVDSVEASISWSLRKGDKLENLCLTGTLAINAVGNERNNTIKGNGAANQLDGGVDGTDELTGLGGGDRFTFSTRPNKFSDFHADRIVDFNAGEGDLIYLNRVSFGIKAALPTLAVIDLPDLVSTGTMADDRKAIDEALSTSALFVYNRTRGELHWNQNSMAGGAGSGGIIAILLNKAELKVSDLVLYG